MYRLRTYPDLVRAELAAAFLRREGVLARAFDTAMDIAGPFAGSPIVGSATVAIAVERERTRAKALLDRFDTEPIELEADWESATDPDLTRLDPALRLRCPDCRSELPRSVGPKLTSQAITCPNCRTTHDLAALVLDQHGPEALEPCYPDTDPPTFDDAALIDAAMDCPACSAPIDGLPITASCPRCSRGFDKRAIARDLFRQ